MTNLFEFISTIVDFVIGLFDSIIYFLSLIPKAGVAISTIIVYTPDYFKALVLPLVAISVILLIVNRG